MSDNKKEAEIRQSYDVLKKTADAVNTENARYDYEMSDLVWDIIKCVLTFAVSFIWLILMLLIFSFIMLNIVKFNIKWMIAVSVVFALIIGLFRTFWTVKKYKGKKIRRSRRKPKDQQK